MRLSVLDRGHRWKQKAAIAVIELVGRGHADPVAKLSLYRPGFFGRPWLRFCASIMRGPSEWSDGEREMIAAFVSNLNACPFCIGIHTGTASLLTGESLHAERFADWRQAGFGPRLAAAFGLVEKANSSPEAIGAADRPAISAESASDALYVAFLFNTINRLANAFDFRWMDDADRMRIAKDLNQIRYSVPAFLLR